MIIIELRTYDKKGIRCIIESKITLHFYIAFREIKRMDIKYKLVDLKAVKPVKSSEDSAGQDLYALHDVIIPSDDIYKIDTGLQLEIPYGYYGQICSRSSHASKRVSVQGGVIDSDYRGNIYVLLENRGKNDYFIPYGKAIAQLIVLPYCNFNFVMTTNDLTETKRGIHGFGSTDNKETDDVAIKKIKLENIDNKISSDDEDTFKSKCNCGWECECECGCLCECECVFECGGCEQYNGLI